MFWLLFAKVFFLFLVTILAAQRKQKTKNHTFAHFSFDFFSLCSFIFPCSSSFFEYRLVILVFLFAPRIRTAGVVAMVAKLLKSEGVRDNTISN